MIQNAMFLVLPTGIVSSDSLNGRTSLPVRLASLT